MAALKANPTLNDLACTEVELSADAGGAGATGNTGTDTASTRRLLIEDFDRDGNMDLVYVSDDNHPARVTYARPPGDTAPVNPEELPLGPSPMKMWECQMVKRCGPFGMGEEF